MKYGHLDPNKQRGGRAGRKVSSWGRGMEGLGFFKYCSTCQENTPRETIGDKKVCCKCKTTF